MASRPPPRADDRARRHARGGARRQPELPLLLLDGEPQFPLDVDLDGAVAAHGDHMAVDPAAVGAAVLHLLAHVEPQGVEVVLAPE
eukprot:8812029-Heterocapsa_arctica.AAC.1